jgi:hypothetical protein
MRNASLSNAVLGPADPAPDGFGPREKTAARITRRALAENDATCDDLRLVTVQHALHSPAANFDRAANRDDVDYAWPMMDVVYHAAGARRSAALRALHDLGFTREEIESIAAEATGQADRTRERVLRGLFGPVQ